MKKFVFSMMMVAFTMVSCTTTPALPAATENDSTTVVDSTTAIDSTVTATVDTTDTTVDTPDSATVEVTE